MEDTIKENKMGVMPIKKLLFTMALPMIISMIVQALYNIIDSVFVAKISENALSAVSLAFPMQNFIIAVSAGIGIGINASLSKSLGRKDFELSNKIASISLFLAFCCWVLFFIIGLFAIDFYLTSQTTVPEIIELGRSYLQIILFGSLGIFFQVICEKVLQSTGLTTHSMIVQGTGAIINIVLDPILIFGLLGFPALGVKGAAYATIIGQLSGGCVGLYFNMKKNPDIKINIQQSLPTMPILKDIFSVGFPSIVLISLSSIMVFFFNIILDSFTPTAIAVFGVCFKLQSLLMMPIFGITNCLVPIIAYNYGAGNLSRITETFKYGTMGAIFIMSSGAFIFQTIPSQLLLIFEASEEMLSIGIPAIKIVSFCYPFMAFNIACNSTFQAVGNGMYSLIGSIVRQILTLMPLAYILSLSGNLDYVWLSFPLSEAVGFIVSIMFLIKVKKRIDSELNPNLA